MVYQLNLVELPIHQMSEQREKEDTPEEGSDSNKKESQNQDVSYDQFSAVYGDWGRWQTLCFLLIGFAVAICTCPTLIMTFMNAKIDFWCKRPDNLRNLDIAEWEALSGGHEGSCQIFNHSYAEMTLVEAKRYV